MKVLRTNNGFLNTLGDLRSRGGVAAKAAEQADAIIGRMSQDPAAAMDEFGRLTKHGESRIAGCFKYDLRAGYRLVCLHVDDEVILLFIGSHDEADRWIDRHRGLRLVVDRATQRLTLIEEPLTITSERSQRSLAKATNPDEALVALLPPDALDRMGLRATTVLALSKLPRRCSDEELVRVVQGVEPKELQSAVLDVLLELRDGSIDEAVAKAGLVGGSVTPIGDDADALRRALESGRNTDVVMDLRDLTPEELRKLLSAPSFTDWMLFLHPDQRVVADALGPKTTLVRGVSGSGKTSVLLHRACTLARRYPDERILVVTLNPALANLLRRLLGDVAPAAEAERIVVRSLSGVCRELALHFEPTLQIPELDAEGEAQLEQFCEDMIGSRDFQNELAPIVSSLVDTRGLDAGRYLRDELLWVRSGFVTDVDSSVSQLPHRNQYCDPDRARRRGREVPFSRDWRERVLHALDYYEDYARSGRFYDAAAVALLAHAQLGKLARERPAPFRFRAVLVDEVQDLGGVELEVVRALAPDAEDGLFLTGDLKQQVFPKEHDLAAAGIQVGQRRYFRRNYRNPRQILEAAVALAQTFGANDDEGDRQSPQYSNRESSKPVVISVESAARELEWVARYVHLKREGDQLPVCMVACELREDDVVALESLAERLRAFDLPVAQLKRDSHLAEGKVYVSALETVKGFEFSLVVVTGCGAGTIPVPALPPEEAWRDANRLYVAMTRARDELVMTHAGEPSRFLQGIAATCSWQPASDLLGPADMPPLGNAGSSADDEQTRAMVSELERLRSENAKLRQSITDRARGIELKVSEKGAVSVYGLGRFPVTLYRDQWERLLAREQEIRDFVRANTSRLKRRDS